MEQKGQQRTEPDTQLSGDQLTREWVQSVTADAVALFREKHPDFAHQVMQSITSGNHSAGQETAPAASALPSARSHRTNSRQKVCLATRELGVATQTATSRRQRLELATQIFIEHEPAIRAMIRRHVGNKDEEDDIYQNLYLSLVCNPVPTPVTSTLAYLNTVIKNDIVDAARRRKSYQEMIRTYATSLVREEVESPPDDRLTQTEDSRRIMDCIVELLPANEARAVIERYVLGYSTTEAAVRMRVKSRTASRYLCVGLRRIREAVLGRGGTTVDSVL